MGILSNAATMIVTAINTKGTRMPFTTFTRIFTSTSEALMLFIALTNAITIIKMKTMPPMLETIEFSIYVKMSMIGLPVVLSPRTLPFTAVK